MFFIPLDFSANELIHGSIERRYRKVGTTNVDQQEHRPACGEIVSISETADRLVVFNVSLDYRSDIKFLMTSTFSLPMPDRSSNVSQPSETSRGKTSINTE